MGAQDALSYAAAATTGRDVAFYAAASLSTSPMSHRRHTRMSGSTSSSQASTTTQAMEVDAMFKKVVWATDGSDAADEALPLARALAAEALPTRVRETGLTPN